MKPQTSAAFDAAKNLSIDARMRLCLAAAKTIVANYRAEAPEGCDPQNVGGLLAGDIPSKRPSLANVLLCAANPEETPLLTRLRKGKALRQFDHKYFVEVKPERKTSGATDGQDVTTYEKGGARYAVEIRAQEFRRSYKVGQQSQEIIEDEAVPDQMAKLRMDMGKEIRKDIEQAMLSSRVSQEDQGTEDNGPKMGGAGYILSAAADSMADKPINTDIRIPSAQRHTGTAANFTETVLTDMMEARRNACGHSSEFVFFVGTTIQRRFDSFENYLVDVTSHTTVLRNMTNQTQDRKVQRGIRFYEGSFGSAQIVIDDFFENASGASTQKRAFGFDMDQLELLPMGSGAARKPLPDLGGGPRELLKMTFAFKLGDPRGHLFIKPSDE